MRVHFIGNTANNHYVLAKAMRRHGLDVRLFYQSDGSFQDRPEAEDPEVARERPGWLRPYRRQFRLWQQRDHVSAELLAELARCDIIHAHGVELIWAARTGRPFIWHPFGADIAVWTTYNRDALIRWKPWPPLPLLPHLCLPPRMRGAIGRASAIALGWHNNLWERGYLTLRELGVENRVARIHLGIDAEKFAPCTENAERDALLVRLLPEGPRQRPVIFHPARQMFTDTASKRGYKANDRLYRALGRFARKGGAFTLVIVEKGLPDEAAARSLLAELGIADRVAWTPAMPRHQLVDWYRAADITAESFYAGAIGSVALESMACGTPVIMHLQIEPEPGGGRVFYPPQDLYPALPPIIRCGSEAEILRELDNTVADPRRLAALRGESRDWIVRYSSADALARRFEELYRGILA
jgi:glycosyltransferase involved in cell wall biosynthesis